MNIKYVVFDIETTGLSPVNNAILEIGAIAIDDEYKASNQVSRER